jgi:hypothetical protein
MFSTPGMFSGVLPDFAGYSGAVSGYSLSTISLHDYKRWISAYQKERLTFLPNFLYFLYDRIVQEHVFPIFVVVIIFILSYCVHWGIAWKYSPLKIVTMIFQLFTRRPTYSKSQFYIHPFDLLAMNDPLRKESAPFTGEYFKYLEYRGLLND